MQQPTIQTNKFFTILWIVLAVITVESLLLPTNVAGQTPGAERDPFADSTSLLPIDSLLVTQRLEAWRAGVYVGVNFNIYSADNLQGMPGVPSCCPGFDEGQGFGVAVGGLVEKPLNDWFSVGGRLYLSTYNGHLIDEEGEVVDDAGFAADAIFEHRIDADIWAVAIEPIALFEVAKDVKLFTGVRGDVVLRKLFAQQERILEPSTISYENGQRTRLEFDGAVPNGTSFQGAALAGIRYDIHLGENKEWVVAPELSAWYSPTAVIREESWKAHGIRLAVSGQYLRFEQKEYTIEPIVPPTSPVEGTSYEIESTTPMPAGGDVSSETSGDELYVEKAGL